MTCERLVPVEEGRKANASVSSRLLLALLLLLAGGCSEDQGPRMDPVGAPVVLSAPEELVYEDEGTTVRVRFLRESGEPAGALPAEISGRGSFEGTRETSPAGIVEGIWTPGGRGSATLLIAVEGRQATVATTVVDRGVVALELIAPASARAGETFDVVVRGMDGKGMIPQDGEGASVEILGGWAGGGSVPFIPGGTNFSLAATEAGFREVTAAVTGGIQAGQEVQVVAGDPAELFFLDESPIGREGDLAVRIPTLHARDAFGNPVQQMVGWSVGGVTQESPREADFVNGMFTPSTVMLGTGSNAGRFRLYDAGSQGGSPVSFAEASLPVLPRVQASGVETAGLPGVHFTGSDLVFEFEATGSGLPAAFSPFSVSAGSAASGEGPRFLDRFGRSGPVNLGDMPPGDYTLLIAVDGAQFTRPLVVREPPVPSSLLLVAGDGQTAVEGSTLAPLLARVLDQEGEGLEAPVLWTASGGSISGSPVSSTDGFAEAYWTLPQEAGTFEARVEVGGLVATFTATATETPRLANLIRVSGDGQSVSQGASAPELLVVETRDQFGDPISVPVTWSGDGSATPATVQSSSVTGRAQASWTVPSQPGSATMVASAEAISVSFSATVVEAPYPAVIEAVSGGGQSGFVGTPLGASLTVRVLDQFGAPIDGQVSFGGPGTFSPSTVTASDATGLAATTWTLPSAPGDHVATAALPSGASATFAANAMELPRPHSIEVLGGAGQAGLAGKELADSLVVLVRDQFGAPIGGMLTWSGPGSFEPGSTNVGANGLGSTVWRLPSDVGPHNATATIGDAQVQITGAVSGLRVGTTIELVSGGGQTGETGAPLGNPIRVRVLDQEGDGFAGTITPSGDGTYSPSGSVEADIDGHAEFVWTLGITEGTQTAIFTVDADALQVTAVATVPTPVHPLTIDGHYLIQTVQTEESTVELVADRDALFRGFLYRTDPGSYTVRLHLRGNGGSILETLTVPEPTVVPVSTPDRLNRNSTFEVMVPGSRITPGMSYVLEVESNAGILADTVYPGVRHRGELPVRFVPIRVDSTGVVGDVDEGSLDAFLGYSESLPFTGVQASVAPEFLWGGSPVTGEFNTWLPLISAVNEARNAQGGTELWYGVVPRQGAGGVAGVGYIGWPVSLGVRYPAFDHGTRYIFNHEVGHNMSLQHAPCNVSPADPDFPFGDGRIGADGFFQGAILAPSTPDIMGYCSGQTFGTYHWGRAMEYTMPTVVSAFGGGSALRFWGHATEEGVALQSPYLGSDVIQVPSVSGPRVRIEIESRTGHVLWSGEGDLLEFSHHEGGSFSVPVPVSALGEGSLDVLVHVTAPGHERRSFSIGETPAGSDQIRVPEGEVYWSDSGQILGFGERGVTLRPAGALVQDASTSGVLRRVTPEGGLGQVVGTLRSH